MSLDILYITRTLAECMPSPETRNRTWTEIDEMYREGIKPWNMKKYRSTRAMENVAVAQNGVSTSATGEA